LLSPSVRAIHAPVYFAEPYSGAKVTQYNVSLPDGPGSKAEFAIPDQCAALSAAAESGGPQGSSPVEKRIWQKAINDCRFYAFLHRFPREQLEDHVTGFDFRNTGLGDLLVSHCGFPVSGEDARACEPGTRRQQGLGAFLEFVEPGADEQGFSNEDCRITQGSFRGKVMFDSDGLRCRFGRRERGFRILSVDYTDANGDGYLDAALRIVSIGPGGGRLPMMLVYTRRSSDDALSLLMPAETAVTVPSLSGSRRQR
jgi:hypothetical protein